VPNPHAGTEYLVRFVCPEFTSLCPVTGQPDFAHLVIDYLPDAYLVESKSLKLFLASFRNHGAFHEDCTVGIGKRLADGKDYAGGTVDKIYPAGFTKISSLGVEQQRVKVIVHFDPKDFQWLRRERDLGVGYRVRVRITTGEEPNALVIPRSALFRGSRGKWNVYAIREGRARTEVVEVGMLNDELAQITSGLAAGDVVVRAPESELEEGQRVKTVVEEGE